jgi:glutaredoxin
MMKIYTNPTCHYCNKIKEQLNEAGLKYEEVVASENQNEWNELIRITGIGMTPTIIMQNEVWLPNRDFRTAEELIERVKHFEESPMTTLTLEEKVDQLHNSVKNISLLINQMNQSLSKIMQNTTIPPINTAQQNIPQNKSFMQNMPQQQTPQ